LQRILLKSHQRRGRNHRCSLRSGQHCWFEAAAPTPRLMQNEAGIWCWCSLIHNDFVRSDSRPLLSRTSRQAMSDNIHSRHSESPDLCLRKPGAEAVSYFRKIAPKADEISASVSAHMEFIHCGETLRRFAVHRAERLSKLEWWAGMDE